MEEREISLIDLILEILLRWRVILICMLVFGVVMGGFSYLRTYRAAKAHSVQQQQESVLPQDEEDRASLLEQLEEQLDEVQKAKVVSLLRGESNYSYRKSYLENSVWAQLDATAAPRTDITYGIVTKNSTEAGIIAQTYRAMLVGGEAYTKLSGKVKDRTGIQLMELLSVAIVADTSTVLEQQNAAQLLQITILEENKEACVKLADAVEQYVESIDVRETFGEYEIVMLSRSYAEVLSTDLLEQQIRSYDTVNALHQSIATVKDGLTDEEKQYYELLRADDAQQDQEDNGEGTGSDTENVSDAEPDVSNATVKGQISKKYVLLGLFMGAFLYAGIFFLVYILGNKIRYCDDISGLYGIPVLGQVPVKEGSKKIFGFIDKWLRALKNGKKRQFSREDAVHLAAVAVKMEAVKEGFKDVYCIGCELQQGADQVCRALTEALKKDNITVKSLNNVLYDAEAREKLRDVKAVVLVEKAGVSMYQEIADELELLKRQKITVLGSVIVE